MSGSEPRIAAPPRNREFDEQSVVQFRQEQVSMGRIVWHQFRKHRLAVISLFVLSVLIAYGLIVPLMTGDLYKQASLQHIWGAPEFPNAPLGYDEIGQNVFVRGLSGTGRLTLLRRMLQLKTTGVPRSL